MKKSLIAFITVFALLLSASAYAEPRTIDIETMTAEELGALKNEVTAAIANLSVENVDGYNIISDYSEYARNPKAHEGEQVRFDGTVVQVMEGVESNSYRVALNGDSDYMFFVDYAPETESERILEDDVVTVFGTFSGLYSYETVLGSEVTIPSCEASAITDVVEVAMDNPATRDDPAAIGATVVYDGASYRNPAVTELTVTSVIRGDAAWSMIRGFNRYNDKPSKEEEYVIVSVNTKAISSPNGEQADLSDYDFNFVSASGVEYGDAYVSGVTPELTKIYPGAEHEGLVVGLVKKEDKPYLVYMSSGDRPYWFDLNKRAPIVLPDDAVLETLQKGDKNDSVKQMQTMLVEMGFLSGTPDGDFGGKSEAAVKAYQEAMGLEATGIADEQTLRLILTATYPEN